MNKDNEEKLKKTFEIPNIVNSYFKNEHQNTKTPKNK